MEFRHLVFTIITATAPLAATAFQPTPGGVFIMNEEKSGNPSNGSVNYFSPTENPSWNYRVFRQANPGQEIPGAICHAHIYDGKLFVISNHPTAPGSYDMAGTLSVLDANSLKLLNSVELVNKHGKTVQGRCAISCLKHPNVSLSHTLLITTTDGILLYSVEDGSILNDYGVPVAISPDGIASPQPYQYPYQTGSMVQVGNVVLAASQSYGLVRIPLHDSLSQANCISITDMFPNGLPQGLSEDNGIGSVVMSSDGNIWMSVTADRNASGNAVAVLIKYDVPRKEFSAVTLPDGIYPPANSWYAWNPDGFHASATGNTLYWNGGESSWSSNSAVYKYDIDNDTFSQVLDLNAEATAGDLPWQIYGCSMRTSPVNGEMYLSLFKDYGDTKYVLRRLSPDGSIIADYPMEPDLWFPSLPVFPDFEGPVLKPFEDLILPSDAPTIIDLFGMASDPDSPDAGITYGAYTCSHPSGDSYHIYHDLRSVYIYPPKVEHPLDFDLIPACTTSSDNNSPDSNDYWIDITANSQGKTDVKRLRFQFSSAGLDDIQAVSHVAAAYVADGNLTLRNESGANATAVIFSPDGRLVMSVDAPAGESIHPLGTLPTGLYLLRFGSTTLKFRL